MNQGRKSFGGTGSSANSSSTSASFRSSAKRNSFGASGSIRETINIERSSETTELHAIDSETNLLDLSKLDEILKEVSSEWLGNFAGATQSSVLGIILLMRLSYINARSGFLLTISIFALAFLLVHISLYYLNKYSNNASWPSILYSVNRKYLGSKIALSIGSLQYIVSLLTSAAFALAASEVIAEFGPTFERDFGDSHMNNEKHSYFQSGIERESFNWSNFRSLIFVAVIICWVGWLATYALPKKLLDSFFYCLPGLAVLLYIIDMIFIIYTFVHPQSINSSTKMTASDFSLFPASNYTLKEYFTYFSLALLPMSGFSLDSLYVNQNLSKYTILDTAPRDSKLSHHLTAFFLILYSALICFMAPRSLLESNFIFAAQFSYESGIAFKSFLLILYIGACIRYLVSASELLTYASEKDSIFPVLKVFSRFELRQSAASNRKDEGGEGGYEHIKRYIASYGHQAGDFGPTIAAIDGVDVTNLGDKSDNFIGVDIEIGSIRGKGDDSVRALVSEDCEANIRSAAVNEDTAVRSGQSAINNREKSQGCIAPSTATSTSSSRVFTAILVTIAIFEGSLNLLARIFAIIMLVITSSIQSFDILSSLAHSKDAFRAPTFIGTITKTTRIILPIIICFLISWAISVAVLLISTGLTIYICIYGGLDQSASPGFAGEMGSRLFISFYAKLLSLADILRSTDDLDGELNWRPSIQVIVVFDDANNDSVTGACSLTKCDENLINLAGRIGQNFSVITGLMKGDISAYRTSKHQLSLENMNKLVKSNGLDAFCSISVVSNIPTAIEAATQVIKIGNVSPNTVMVLWPENWESMSPLEIEDVYANYKLILSANKTLALLKGSNSLPSQSLENVIGGTIDIWWVVSDGGLLLLLPYLLTLNKQWSRTTLRLFVVISRAEDNPEKFRLRALRYMKHVRVQAEVRVIDISSSSGDMAWVYEKTIDTKMRTKLLRSLGAHPTLSMAIRSDTVWVGRGKDGGDSSYSSSTRVPHIADIFNMPRGNTSNSNISSSSYSNPFAEVSKYPDRQGEARRGSNWKLGDDSSNSTRSSISSHISARGGAASVTLSKELVDDPAVVDVALRAETKLISQKQCVDFDRTLVALLLNRQLREHSHGARLIVTSFPLVRRLTAKDTLSYVDVLTKNVAPVLLVRGTGKEYITSF